MHTRHGPDPRCPRVRRKALIVLAALIGATLSCTGDGTTGPLSSGDKVLELLTAADVEARAGSTIDPAPAIRVKDKRTGRPVAGIQVEFWGTPSLATFAKRVATTDSVGVATVGAVQAGYRPGNWGIVVLVGDLKASFLLHVKPDVPARLDVSTRSVVALSDEVIEGPTATVFDRFSNRVPKVSVTFTITSTDGLTETLTQLTNEDGTASLGKLRLGGIAGVNAITARVEGVDPVRVAVVGLDAGKVVRYNLESVSQYGKMRAPADVGLVRSTLAITRFDSCVCQSAIGHYLINVEYQFNYALEPTRIGGEFVIDPPLLRMDGRPVRLARVAPGFIEIEIQRDDWDWQWEETWIYREVAP